MMKILFIIPSFQIGGTNKVLLSIVKKINEQNRCDVFSIIHNNDPLNIKKNCHVLGEKMIIPRSSLRNALQSFDIVSILINLLFLVSKNWGRIGVRDIFLRRAVKYLSSMNYDLVIGMEEGMATELASMVISRKKIAWVHCDYSRYKALNSDLDEASIYERFDSVACVSQYTAQVFSEIYPFIKGKVKVLYNPIDTELILHRSDEKDLQILTMSESDHIIVSIGRLDPVKRFSHIPAVAAKLKEQGLKFIWYIIGDGSERDAIIEKINELCVTACIVMTGFLANPYPLIKKASLLVIMSESEACPNVIYEAMILSVPVITTNYPTAYEYIETGKNGMITSLQKIGDTILSVLNDWELYASLVEEVKNTNLYIECKMDAIHEYIDSMDKDTHL